MQKREYLVINSRYYYVYYYSVRYYSVTKL